MKNLNEILTTLESNALLNNKQLEVIKGGKTGIGALVDADMEEASSRLSD